MGKRIALRRCQLRTLLHECTRGNPKEVIKENIPNNPHKYSSGHVMASRRLPSPHHPRAKLVRTILSHPHLQQWFLGQFNRRCLQRSLSLPSAWFPCLCTGTWKVYQIFILVGANTHGLNSVECGMCSLYRMDRCDLPYQLR